MNHQILQNYSLFSKMMNELHSLPSRSWQLNKGTTLQKIIIYTYVVRQQVKIYSKSYSKSFPSGTQYLCSTSSWLSPTIPLKNMRKQHKILHQCLRRLSTFNYTAGPHVNLIHIADFIVSTLFSTTMIQGNLHNIYLDSTCNPKCSS